MPKPSEETVLVGTRWPSKEKTGDGRPFKVKWATMARRLANPKPAPRNRKSNLPIWTLGRFGEKTEAQAKEEHEERLKTEPGAKRTPHGPHYRDTKRHLGSGGLVLDYDANPGLDAKELLAAWGDVCFLAHTSWSHDPDRMPKWRVLIPLNREVSAEEYWILMSAAGRRLDGLDRCPAAQGYFIPAKRENYDYVCNEDGAPWPVDNILEGEQARQNQEEELARQKRAEDPPSPPPLTQDDRLRRYALAALDSECQAVSSMSAGTGADGGRHKRILLAAKSMGSLEVSCGLSRTFIEGAILDAADQCGAIKNYGLKSVKRTIADGYRMGIENPRAPEDRQQYGARDPAPPFERDDIPPPDDGDAPWDDSDGEEDDKPQVRKSVRYRLTDVGNALRYRDEHGHNLRYCEPLGGWFVWNGCCWERDELGRAMQLAKQSAVRMRRDAESLANDEPGNAYATALLKWSKESEGKNKLDNMRSLARWEPPIPVRVEQWDQDHWLLNTPGAVFDLREGTHAPNDRDHFITRRTLVEYDPAAECPRWMEFLHDIMVNDFEMVTFLQRAVGYSITGVQDEQCLFFLHGAGANGKSTFLGTLEKLLHDYSKHVDPEVLAVSKNVQSGPTPELARLRGARFVSTVEVEHGRRLAEGLIKQITGGEPIVASFKYRDPFEFQPAFKLWFAANHEPRIIGRDLGIWRRIHKVPFEYTVPNEKRNKHLLKELIDEEGPGILRWAVEGCLLWQARGLDPPDVVTAATEQYKDDQDALRPWLDECCVVDSKSEATIGALYLSYNKWAKANGEKEKSKNMLGRLLTERGFGMKKGSGGKRVRVGLRLTGEPSQEGMGWGHEAGEA